MAATRTKFIRLTCSALVAALGFMSFAVHAAPEGVPMTVTICKLQSLSTSERQAYVGHELLLDAIPTYDSQFRTSLATGTKCDNGHNGEIPLNFPSNSQGAVKDLYNILVWHATYHGEMGALHCVCIGRLDRFRLVFQVERVEEIWMERLPR